MAKERDSDKKMFRAQALEQLSSPEQLDQLLQVTNRRSWIWIATLAGGVVAAVVWSVFGQIPITVDGIGILVYPRQVVSFQSPASGEIVSLDIRVGDVIESGQVIGTINQPDVAQRLEQERIRLAEARARDNEVSGLAVQRTAMERDAILRKRSLLETRIESITSMAQAQRDRTERYIGQQRANIEKMRAEQARLGKTLQARYESFQRLRDEGLSSEDQVLNARQRTIDNEVQRADLELKLQQIELRCIEAEDSFVQQMDRVGELRTQLQELDIQEAQREQRSLETAADRKLKIQELLRNIERYELELANKGKIVSEYSGRVLEVTVGLGQIISAGQRLGSIEAEDPEGKLVGLAYFAVGDGKKVKEGMEIRITPSTVERERHGSMIAEVRQVSTFSVTTDAVTSVVGNNEVARELTKGGTKIQVFADLVTDPSSPTGYRWTSGKGPDEDITAGTTTSVRATVEYRRPITFVIPILRRWSGIG